MKELKTDCFAFISDSRGLRCSILKENMWNCTGCHFYKTKQEYDEQCAHLKYKNKE